MELQFVKMSVEDRVATIVIDHPPANALNTPTMDELSQVIDEVISNKEIKAAVITGAGMFFVAGADINEIATLKNAEQGETITLRGQSVINKIENSHLVAIHRTKNNIRIFRRFLKPVHGTIDRPIMVNKLTPLAFNEFTVI